MGQRTNALLGGLSAPGGDAPDGPQRRALRASARALAAAKADLDTEMSLTFTGYGSLTRVDPATRAQAARLARKLGFGPVDSGRATSAWPPRARGSGSAARTGDAGGAASSFGAGFPWRFGVAENPYLSWQAPGGGGLRPPTSQAMAAYMRALQKAHAGAARSSDGGPVPPSIALLREGAPLHPSHPHGSVPGVRKIAGFR